MKTNCDLSLLIPRLSLLANRRANSNKSISRKGTLQTRSCKSERTSRSRWECAKICIALVWVWCQMYSIPMHHSQHGCQQNCGMARYLLACSSRKVNLMFNVFSRCTDNPNSSTLVECYLYGRIQRTSSRIDQIIRSNCAKSTLQHWAIGQGWQILGKTIEMNDLLVETYI